MGSISCSQPLSISPSSASIHNIPYTVHPHPLTPTHTRASDPWLGDSDGWRRLALPGSQLTYPTGIENSLSLFFPLRLLPVVMPRNNQSLMSPRITRSTARQAASLAASSTQSAAGADPAVNAPAPAPASSSPQNPTATASRKRKAPTQQPPSPTPGNQQPSTASTRRSKRQKVADPVPPPQPPAQTQTPAPSRSRRKGKATAAMSSPEYDATCSSYLSNPYNQADSRTAVPLRDLQTRQRTLFPRDPRVASRAEASGLLRVPQVTSR